MRLSNIALAITAVYPRVFMPGYSLGLDFTSANNRLDSRITFSRTSNATLTGSNGLIQYAPHNLLTYSEQFDNAAWTKTGGVTVAANVIAAPDGTNTSDKVVSFSGTGVTQRIYRINADTTNVQTLSVYLKYSGVQYVVIGYSNSGSVNVTFDVLNGTITSAPTSGGMTASITAVGDGWYRCSYSGVIAGIQPSIMLTSTGALAGLNSTTFVGDGTSGIYLWGAQLEIGSTATTYNPTTVKNLLGYTQEFDNAAWTKSNSFVQTNLLTYSQEFDNTAWVKSSATVTSNTAVAPDGTSTADRVAATTTGNSRGVYQAATTASASHTISLYAKADGLNYLCVYNETGTAAGVAWFNLSNGTVGTVVSGYSATITSAGNGWYLCKVTATFTAGTRYFFVGGVDADNSVAVISTTNGIYIWGAQLVQGSVAGNYQPTTSAAKAVMYAAPDGSMTADKLVANATSNAHYCEQLVTTSASTYSMTVYAKAGEVEWVRLFIGSAGNAYYNVSTGVVGTVSAGMTTSIQSVGGGWYRCSVSGVASAAANTMRVYVSNADNTAVYTGDGTSGIYIWGAQLSDSASVDPYVYNPVAAPTAAAYYGPRFDYDPVTLAPKGLLIEEQRTNLVLNSAILNTQVVTVSAVAHTLSFYGTGTVILSGAYTGTVVGTGGYPTRTTLTFTPIVGALTLTITGSVTMAQLEAGAFATSYIPTVASQVTRAADNASMIGANFSNWFNAVEGTMFAEGDGYSTGNSSLFVVRDSLTAYANQMSLDRIGSANTPRFAGNFNAVSQFSFVGGTNFTTGTVFKLVGAYQVNNFAASFNGSAASTDTSGSVPTNIAQAELGKLGLSQGEYLNGHLKRLAYYPRRLANSELQAITA